MINTKKFLIMGFLLALLIFASGCSPAQPTQEPATEVPVEMEQATQPPTEAPTATDEEEAVEEPEETEEPEDSESDDAVSAGETSACIECHTDQAMLIDTAEPVEEVESENEGSG
jgi:hypothetical protein